MKILIVLGVLAACEAFGPDGFGMPGGWSSEHRADLGIQALADQVRDSVEMQTGVNGFSKFVVVKYRVQTVAGFNYILKINVGYNSYIHVRLFKAIDSTVTFQGVQTGKSFFDPIEIFY